MRTRPGFTNTPEPITQPITIEIADQIFNFEFLLIDLTIVDFVKIPIHKNREAIGLLLRI
jgi:hypothetical protein